MTNISDSAWSCYEQTVVILSLLIAMVVAAIAFVQTKVNIKAPFLVDLTWDFSRSWASNISGLAGILGVSAVNAISLDFKPFANLPIKTSYTITTLLMSAIVIAAPSVYSLLQIRRNNHLVGCAGGFLAASTLTIWGTVAQLLLQIALLVGFIHEKASYRFGLYVVPVILAIGLILLFPYSVKSIQVALANETQSAAKSLVDKPRTLRMLDELEDKVERIETGIIIAPDKPRKLALL
jgi:hypothetical protein